MDDASEGRLLLKTRLLVSGRVRVVGEGADAADAVQLARPLTRSPGRSGPDKLAWPLGP